LTPAKTHSNFLQQRTIIPRSHQHYYYHSHTRYPTFLRIASAPTISSAEFNTTSPIPSDNPDIKLRKKSLSTKASQTKINNDADASDSDDEPIPATTIDTTTTINEDDNWRQHSDLNPTLTLPTWAVPLKNTRSIQALLSSELTQPFLATRDDILQHIHPRPKIVQNADEHGKTHKVILLRSNIQHDKLPRAVLDLLQEHDVTRGPEWTVSIDYHQFPVGYILERLLPKHVHPVPTSFETVGHVAHLNLQPEHVPYAKLIGQVLLESLPPIETVIQKVGQVSGPYRTYDYQVLAGRPATTVQLMEHGIRLDFDLSQVYWCSRLAQERQVILDQEIQPGQVIADAFAGVGAICLRAAQTKNCTILANDWNPNAVKYLKHNFALNKLEQYLGHVSCQDAYDFLMDLGLEKPPLVVEGNYDNGNDDESETADKVQPIHHVLMNFPLKAPSFLGALRWWPESLGQSNPRLHVYTFARADPATERSAEDVAVDLVASELLPLMGNSAQDDGGQYCRMAELNGEYGCNVVAREVRDVAPGKIVFCVSFTATSKLLRHMQGNFI
jgi:tRNA (guanine37-N1)-methyltransferase